MNDKYEKYYIEITYNEKAMLRTFLFNTEAEAIKWWEMAYISDELATAYLLKEFGKENEFKTDIEIVRSLK